MRSPAEVHASLATSVASPAEITRTAMRILLLNLHRGLSRLDGPVRQSCEARDVSQALYAASDFFNNDYDPAVLHQELQRLCETLTTFVLKHGYDPFHLNLYATGDLRRARSKTAVAQLPDLKPRR